MATTKVIFLKSVTYMATPDTATYPVDPAYKTADPKNADGKVNYRTAWDGPDPTRCVIMVYNIGDIANIDSTIATAWIAAGICQTTT